MDVGLNTPPLPLTCVFAEMRHPLAIAGRYMFHHGQKGSAVATPR
jgi:hypothetical protein